MEIQELESWVKADPENAKVFSGYQTTWKALEHTRIHSSINVDHEWNMLASRLRTGEKSLHIRCQGEQSKKSQISNSGQVFLSWSLRAAAIFLLLAIPAYFLYNYLGSNAEKQLSATSGVVEQTLPDGTVVTLNAGATLSYPERFEGRFRKVTLKGEGWFEVAHDKTRPFIISADNVRIRVVGTSFFVNTKTLSDTKEVILSTGVVRVYYANKPEETEMLLPGDKAELSSSGCSIVKSSNSDVNFLAWKTRHIVFANSPLNEVVAILSNVYQSNITLSDDRLSNCRITTTFDKQSLESVLHVLKATLDIQVSNTGDGFTLSGRGCDPSH
jgi:ferric-dicitrate binding protein FerR (iron transport regulator)